MSMFHWILSSDIKFIHEQDAGIFSAFWNEKRFVNCHSNEKLSDLSLKIMIYSRFLKLNFDK